MTTSSPSSDAPTLPSGEGAFIRVAMGLLSQDADQFTGTATYVRGLLGELRRRNSTIALELLCNEHAAIAFRQPDDSPVALKRASNFRVGTSRVSRVTALISARLLSRRFARQFSSGVHVVHFPLTLMVPHVDLPTVVTLYDLNHHDMPQNFGRSELMWRRHFYDSAAQDATLVVTLSEHARGRLIECLGLAPERVVAIACGVDRERFSQVAGAVDDEVLAEFRLPPRYLLYPSSLWSHKNHSTLLAALARMANHDIHLVLTGATFGRLEELMRRAADLRVAERVRHLGVVSDAAMPVLYRHAVALVYPSSYEGFGVPPLEAMACGCPVASSLATSLREVCGEAALTIDPTHPDQIATTLDRLVEDEDLGRHMSGLGLAQAARFSWEAAAEAHIRVYRRAAEIGASRG